MKIADWPIYITDEYKIRCYQQGCPDDELPHPGRRITVGEFLGAIKLHALNDHGINLEDK